MTDREEEYTRARDQLSRLLDRNDPRLPFLFKEAEMFIPLSEGWRRVDFLNASGEMIPVRRRGELLMLVWHHPEAEDLLPHAHPFDETFTVVSGELDLHIDEEEPVHLVPADGPFVVPARKWHEGRVSAGAKIITTYPSDVFVQESLTTEPSKTPIIPETGTHDE